MFLVVVSRLRHEDGENPDDDLKHEGCYDQRDNNSVVTEIEMNGVIKLAIIIKYITYNQINTDYQQRHTILFNISFN